MNDYKDNVNANTTVSEPAINEEENVQTDGTLTIITSAFPDQGQMPVKYCNVGVDGGENVSIPVSWANSPDETSSFFLVIVDTHPVAENFIHWAVKDIPANISGIAENSSNRDMPGGVELTNGYSMTGYGSPQPPVGTGEHAYEIYLFALNTDEIQISDQPSWSEIQTKLAPYIIDSAKYVGFYGR